MRHSRGSCATERTIPVGLELVPVGAAVEAKADQGARLERLDVEAAVVGVGVEEQGDRDGGGGDGGRRMGMGTVADPEHLEHLEHLEHCGPGSAAEFQAPTKRSPDVPRMDEKARR